MPREAAGHSNPATSALFPRMEFRRAAYTAAAPSIAGWGEVASTDNVEKDLSPERPVHAAHPPAGLTGVTREP